jgi:hypothetical protein
MEGVAKSSDIEQLITAIENIINRNPDAWRDHYPPYYMRFRQRRDICDLFWTREIEVPFKHLSGSLLNALKKYEYIFGSLTIVDEVGAMGHWVFNFVEAESTSRKYELRVIGDDKKLVKEPVWTMHVTLAPENRLKKSFDDQELLP